MRWRVISATLVICCASQIRLIRAITWRAWLGQALAAPPRLGEVVQVLAQRPAVGVQVRQPDLLAVHPLLNLPGQLVARPVVAECLGFLPLTIGVPVNDVPTGGFQQAARPIGGQRGKDRLGPSPHDPGELLALAGDEFSPYGNRRRVGVLPQLGGSASSVGHRITSVSSLGAS